MKRSVYILMFFIMLSFFGFLINKCEETETSVMDKKEIGYCKSFNLDYKK